MRCAVIARRKVVIAKSGRSEHGPAIEIPVIFADIRNALPQRSRRFGCTSQAGVIGIFITKRMRKGEINPDQNRTASRLIAPITITSIARVIASAITASVSASIARVSADICSAHQPFVDGLPPPQMARRRINARWHPAPRHRHRQLNSGLARPFCPRPVNSHKAVKHQPVAWQVSFHSDAPANQLRWR